MAGTVHIHIQEGPQASILDGVAGYEVAAVVESPVRSENPGVVK